MELTFLGTASAYPSPARGVSCIVYRNEGVYWMFDCGEGSQIQIQRSNIRCGKISKIFITHLHGDHVFGLPGLMCRILSMKEPLEVYGPVGLRRFLRTALLLSQTLLDYEYVVHELLPVPEQLTMDLHGWPEDHESNDRLHPNEQAGRTITADGATVWHLFEDAVHIVRAGWLQHRIPSFGFTVQEKDLPGRLDPCVLKAKGVAPGPLYAKIKAGETITAPSGETIRPVDVVGPARPGRLVALLGDSCDSYQMAALCQGADVIVHEATMEDAREADALEKGHSTAGMAGRFAHSVGAQSLILTHFSQRYKPASTEEAGGEDSVSVSLLVQQAKQAFLSDHVTAAEDLVTCSVPARKPFQ